MLNLKIVRFAHYRHAVNGKLFVGGMHVCDTLEHEAHCLLPGSYPLLLVYDEETERNQILIKLCDLLPWETMKDYRWPRIMSSNGPYLLTDGSVSVGECHHLGFLVKCNVHFELLHNRLRKALKRGGEAQLTIVNEVAMDAPVVDNAALHWTDISA